MNRDFAHKTEIAKKKVFSAINANTKGSACSPCYRLCGVIYDFLIELNSVFSRYYVHVACCTRDRNRPLIQIRNSINGFIIFVTLFDYIFRRQ